MNRLTIITPLPYIETEVVKKGATTAYVLETGQTDGFNGTVSDIKPEEVTLTGYRKGVSATLKITAAQLRADNYTAFKYAQNMSETSEGSSGWTKEADTEMINPGVCRPGCFIMYRKNESEAYTNGLIVTVEREKMTVSTVSAGKNTVVTLTLAEMKKDGFSAEVSPEIYGIGAEGNEVIVKNAELSSSEISNTENLWFNM